MRARFPNQGPATVVVAAILLVGLAAAVVALSNSGADIGLAPSQQRLVTLQPRQLSALLVTTNDPRPGSGHGHAVSARCTPFGHGVLRNPWSCSVGYPASNRYRGAPSVDYRIIVASDGSVAGVAPGGLSVNGCCVATRLTQWPYPRTGRAKIAPRVGKR